MKNDFDFSMLDLMSSLAAADNTPEKIAEREAASERSKLKRSLELSRIPPRYQWALEHPKAATTLGCDASTAKRLGVIPSDRCAAFRGPTGAGKTTLACLALWGAKLRDRNLRVLFVTATELERERRVTRLGTDSAELERRATAADIVLIDEIGQEVGAFSPLVDIVFARYDALKPTWVTTGVGASTLSEKYGAGFVRRIFEGAEVFTLTSAKK